jgi:hypothetical protein
MLWTSVVVSSIISNCAPFSTMPAHKKGRPGWIGLFVAAVM